MSSFINNKSKLVCFCIIEEYLNRVTTNTLRVIIFLLIHKLFDYALISQHQDVLSMKDRVPIKKIHNFSRSEKLIGFEQSQLHPPQILKVAFTSADCFMRCFAPTMASECHRFQSSNGHFTPENFTDESNYDSLSQLFPSFMQKFMSLLCLRGHPTGLFYSVKKLFCLEYFQRRKTMLNPKKKQKKLRNQSTPRKILSNMIPVILSRKKMLKRKREKRLN